MPIQPAPDQIRLAELVDLLDRRIIRVNPAYQRSGKIWPARAKSFLVETVLLGMPIPHVLLHDLDTPATGYASDIIDGQQRCSILASFRRNEFALTTDVDDEGLYGSRYDDLTPRQKAAFRDYVVHLDRYSNVTPRDIRQVFRRLNYYTAPLNAAEQRHAQFYGELSRFAEDQCREWQPVFRELRVFTKSQLNRKADQQLMAEILDAMLNGFSTPTAKSLRKVYHDHERQFSSAQDFRRRLDLTREEIASWLPFSGGPLAKHYQVFALVLAVMHSRTNLASVRGELGRSLPLRTPAQIIGAFAPLERAVRAKVELGRYARFWAASHEMTNTWDNRLIRSKYYYAAVTGAPLRVADL